MEHHLRWLIRQRFGHKSDTLDPDQLLLIAKEMLEPPAAEPAQQKEPEHEKRPARKRTGHGRRPIPRDLPRKTIHYPVPLEERVCDNCDIAKKKIGEEKQEQLERVPAQWYVIEHVQDKYACPKCGEGVTTAEKPPQPIEKGLGGSGLLADVIVYKYEYHLPLNRLEKKYAREGVRIARSTMAGWMAECAWALKPIYKVMRDEVLGRSVVIHTDDTPVPVLERGRKHTKTGRQEELDVRRIRQRRAHRGDPLLDLRLGGAPRPRPVGVHQRPLGTRRHREDVQRARAVARPLEAAVRDRTRQAADGRAVGARRIGELNPPQTSEPNKHHAAGGRFSGRWGMGSPYA
jgi:transposase